MSVDIDVLLTKIESLRKCLLRIEQKRPVDRETLQRDLDLQDIISVNLERAIQQCVDIAAILIADSEDPPPATMSSSIVSLAGYGVISMDLAERLRKAVGFRNIAVHEYSKIDWDIVYSIITEDIDDFKKFVSAVLKYADIAG